MTNDNINIDSVEVEFDGSIEDGIEQLPHDEPSVDHDDDMNNLPASRRGHASKRYITFAILGGTAAAAAFYGSGFGIGKAAANNSNASTSVSSASNMVVRTNSDRSSKSGKGRKSGKCSKIRVRNSKSAKSTRILSKSIKEVTLPVEFKEDCDECIIKNVAITVGINFPFGGSGRTSMDIESPAGPNAKSAKLLDVDLDESESQLVSKNKITFDDDAAGALDPNDIFQNIDADGNIRAGTYLSEGNPKLGTFVGTGLDDDDPVEGNWTFVVENVSCGNEGTIESVELDITCESE